MDKIKKNNITIFPIVIEKNLNIEKFLYDKKYEEKKLPDSILIEFFEDFSYLKGFQINIKNIFYIY